jgi:hypothetical protein
MTLLYCIPYTSGSCRKRQQLAQQQQQIQRGYLQDLAAYYSKAAAVVRKLKQHEWCAVKQQQ